MNGHVDSAGCALVRIVVTSPATATAMDIEAWVDTGFTGELVLPQDRIAALGLPRSAVVRAELGDGSETVLEVYSCLIEWSGLDPYSKSKSLRTLGRPPSSVSDFYKVTR
jgi:clan AA aspartic protease